MSNHANEMCDPDLSDDDRLRMWLCIYYAEWNSFPVQQMNEALDTSTEKLLATIMKIVRDKDLSDLEQMIDVKNLALALDLITAEDNTDRAMVVLKAAANAGFSKSIHVAIRTTIARGVVESSVRINAANQVAGNLGRRGAIVVLEQSASLAGGQAASKVFTALADPLVGIGAAVGEFTAVCVLNAFGIDNPTVVIAASGASGILVAAGYGACFGGLVGAGVGATVGAGTFAIGQTFGAIFNAVRGGYDDNWCYIQVGTLRKGDDPMSVGTYKAADGIYACTFNTIYYESGRMDYFSAGNEQDKTFQVQFWDEWGNKIKFYPKVSYRDTFYISKRGTSGDLVLVYARGGFNQEGPGLVECHYHK